MDNLYTEFQKLHVRAHTRVEEWLRQYIARMDNASHRCLYTDAIFPGRRIRSTLLCLMCDNMSAVQSDHLQRLAVLLELLHRGSIILDDFIDGDVERRGVPTFHVRHGREAMMWTVEQFLRQIKSLAPTPLLSRITYSTIRRMTMAQLADIGFLRSFNSFRNIYTYRVLQKTSEPFALIGVYASFLRNQDHQSAHQLVRILRLFGRLYQIENDFYDDLLADTAERATKSEFAGTVSLTSSIILDCGPPDDQRVIRTALQSNSIGLNPNYADKYYRVLRQPKYMSIARTKRDQARHTLRKSINQLPPVDQKLLMALYQWVTIPEFWDHTKAAEAGFHNL